MSFIDDPVHFKCRQATGAAEQEAAETRRQLDEARGDAARLRALLEQALDERTDKEVLAAEIRGALIAGTPAAPAPNPPQPPLAANTRESERQFVLSQAFDWERWPKLASIFQNRPRVNIYWQELADFVVFASPFREIPTAPPLPQGVETPLRAQVPIWNEVQTLIAEHVEGALFSRRSRLTDAILDAVDRFRSAPQAPATFEQLVTAAGPLPTTGLASAAPAPGAVLDPLREDGDLRDIVCRWLVGYKYTLPPGQDVVSNLLDEIDAHLRSSREGVK